MEIHTKQEIKNLEGVVMKENDKDVTLGKVLGTMLAHSKVSSDPVKLWILAEKFYTQDVVEIDEADLSLVEKVVTESDYFPLVKGQTLKMLRDAKV